MVSKKKESAALSSDSVAVLLRMIDEGFNRSAWHGANLKGSLRGVDVETALWQLRADRPSIWDIVVHVAYCKYLLWRRTAGIRSERFPRPATANRYWRARPEIQDERAWRKDLAMLADYHERFRSVVASLADTRRDHKLSTLLHRINGCALHDVYHAGQIQYIKKLRRQAR